MTALEIRSLTKWYGGARGVENVTFALQPGEVFGYLGPNGSGKTTTLRCLMGLLAPSSGELHVLGHPVVPGQGTQHHRMGYLPGEFRLWPAPRAGDSLQTLGALGHHKGIPRRRQELAERLDLDLNRPVRSLSKGNRQKIGVIYAFQHQPEILILDEPTSGLDPLMRQVVLDLIQEAAEGGATTLLSSHDLSEVAAVCGKAGILREGRLVHLSSLSEMLRQEAHPLRAWFTDRELLPALAPELSVRVQVVHQQPGMIHLSYRGPVDDILKWVARFPVDRIEIPRISLEQAFIHYFSKNEVPSTGSSATPPGGLVGR